MSALTCASMSSRTRRIRSAPMMPRADGSSSDPAVHRRPHARGWLEVDVTPEDHDGVRREQGLVVEGLGARAGHVAADLADHSGRQRADPAGGLGAR